MDSHDLRPGAGIDLRRDGRRRAVGAVDHDADALQVVRQRGEQVTLVEPARQRLRIDALRRGACRTIPRLTQSLLDRVLDRVVEPSTPPRAKNLMPLSGIGLCEADSMTPMSALSASVRNATPGVGSTPTRMTSTPALASPATTAASRTHRSHARHGRRRWGGGPRTHRCHRARGQRRRRGRAPAPQ